MTYSKFFKILKHFVASNRDHVVLEAFNKFIPVGTRHFSDEPFTKINYFDGEIMVIKESNGDIYGFSDGNNGTIHFSFNPIYINLNRMVRTEIIMEVLAK